MAEWRGAYLRPLREIYTRLSTASGTGKKLAGSKVYIGPRVMIEEIEDTPSIVIDIDSIRDTPGHAGARNQSSGEIVFSGSIKYGIADDRAANRYYSGTAGAEAGFIAYLENFADVLNETTDTVPVISPRLGENCQAQIILSMNNFRYHGNIAIVDFTIEAKTIDFTFNARRTAT
jgi:hypothetical protein